MTELSRDSARPLAAVTGGASGLGRQISLDLARAGVDVLLVARTPSRLAEAKRSIEAEVGRPAVETLETSDLALRSETARIADLLARRDRPVDVLVNNAGALYARRQTTVEGVERTFALNVLAPFALSYRLAPSLARRPGSRIVNIASAAHRSQRLEFDNLQLERRYRGYRAYARSKLALLLLTREFARRLGTTGPSVNAVHPGFVRTNFGQNNPGAIGFGFRLAEALFAISVRRGARTPVLAARGIVAGAASGDYVSRGRVRSGSAASRDRDTAQRLFEECRRLVGLEGVDLTARPPPAA